MIPVSQGKPYAGNPHVRFEEGASASEEPRRSALLHKTAVANALIAGTVALAFLLSAAGEQIAQPKDSSFASFYTNWRAFLEFKMLERPGSSSIMKKDELYDNEYFRGIVKLGCSALGDIVQTASQDRLLWEAVQRITKWKYHVVRTGSSPLEFEWNVAEIPSIVTRSGPPDQQEVWLYWWRLGRFQTEVGFKELYSRWCKLHAENRQVEADRVYRQIVNLGLPVLPCLVDVVDEHSEFVAAVSELTDGALPKNARPDECKAWWKENKERFTLPPLSPSEENSAPSPNLDGFRGEPSPGCVSAGSELGGKTNQCIKTHQM